MEDEAWERTWQELEDLQDALAEVDKRTESAQSLHRRAMKYIGDADDERGAAKVLSLSHALELETKAFRLYMSICGEEPTKTLLYNGVTEIVRRMREAVKNVNA